jgi:hypothetical protein
MGLRDHVRGNYFAYSFSRRGAGIYRTPNRRHIATHNRRHETGVNFFPTDEPDIRCLYHRVRGLDHCYESATFNHSERFRHCSLLPQINTDFSVS